MAGSLRSFVDADRQAVLGLSRHALARIEEQVGKPLWGTRAELDDDLDSWSGSPSESLRVIEEDGRVVGFGGVQLDGNGAVVGPLVSPASRGRKMGSTLLDAAIEIARDHGAEWLTAAVGPRNVPGRLLLERRGFRPRVDALDAVYRLMPADHRRAGPAPPHVGVRPGAVADLPVVWALYREAFPIGRRPQETWERWLADGEVVVAEYEDAVVAFVHVEAGARWITHVGVAEDARGLGVGGYLFSHALEDYWLDHPGQELRLTVIPSNTPAIRLYRRLGFAPWLLLEVYELELGPHPKG